MNFFFLITLFCASLLVGADDDVGSMLQNLRKKSELHNETKEENAGFVTIYSREDLDRMQAYTLKDILKSTPFMTYQEGGVGTPGIANVGAALDYMPTTRLYIDNHEVSSTYFGSAFYIYGDMKLGFVDHIEIYQGGNGLEFGIESSLRTIRVYTKTPHRENNTQAKILADNRGSLSESLYSGKEIDDVEYGVYVSGNNNNREDFSYKGNSLSKSAKKTHLLMTLKTKGFSLLTSRYDSLQDGFAGLGTQKTPKGTNEIDKYHQFIYASYDISDNLIAYASIDDSISKMEFNELKGYNGGLSSSLDVRWKENVFKAGLKGNKAIASNNLKYGFEYAEKVLKPEVSEYGNLNTLDVRGPTRININSFYIEDSLRITEASTLTATSKFDYFSNNYKNEAKIEPVFRLAYTYNFDEDYKMKISYNHTYMAPSLYYTTTYSGKTQINPELLPSRYDGFSTEFTKTSDKSQVKLGAIHLEVKDGIYFNPTQVRYDNSLGASYKVNKKLSFDIKGENIFDKAIQTPVVGIGSVGSMDRVFIIGMEYLF